MDPASAFSLACGIIQLVQIACKVGVGAKDLYQKGSIARNQDIEEQVSELQDLQSLVKSKRRLPHFQDTTELQEDRELVKIAGKCEDAAQRLLSELEKLKMPVSHNAFEAFGKSIKARFRLSAIESLQAEMDKYQNILGTRILINIRARMNQVNLQQSEGFKEMNISMQKLAMAFREGQDLTIDRLGKTIHDQGDRIIQHIDIVQHGQNIREERDKDKLLREKFLESLVFPEIFSREDSVSPAHEKTFRWIFDRSGTKVRPWDNFVRWLETGSSTYWIKGKAGSGKSTLMRFICENPCTTEALHTWAADKELLMPVFYFWAAGTTLQQSVEGFLRSVIVQLLDKHQNLIPRLSQLETRLTNVNGAIYAWTEEKLLKCLKMLISELSSECRICLFVDGLDEFNGDYEPLVELIQKFVLNPHFKCCFSSRPENEFEDNFKSSSLLKLQDLTHDDIWSYVEAKLKGFERLERLTTEEQIIWQDCVSTIVEKADGVFLWVKLVVSGQIIGLKNKDPPELLLKRLHSLPKTVQELYCSMLAKIDDLYREEAAWYMKMALHCSNSEYRHAEDHNHSNVCDYAMAKFGLTESLQVSHELTAENIPSKCSTVRDRILTTCGGILEVCGKHDRVQSDEKSNPDQINVSDETSESDQIRESGKTSETSWASESRSSPWLSWESIGRNRSYKGPDWSHVTVQFSHRTAKDFIETSDAGQLFLRHCKTFPRCPALLFSATHVVYMSICQLEEKIDYMRGHASSFLAHARHADPESEKSLYSLIPLMDSFNDQIQSLFRQLEPTKKELRWCQVWFFKTSLMDISYDSGRSRGRGKIYPAEGDPDDFLSLCALVGVNWYVQEKLKARVISPSKASQLALCCGINYMDNATRLERLSIVSWNYVDGTELLLLRTLMRFQADPTVGVNISIWQAALESIYDAKCGFILDDSEKLSDQEYISVIDAFLQAGANQDQKLTLVIQPLKYHGGIDFRVEVNIDDLPFLCRHEKGISETHERIPTRGMRSVKPSREACWIRGEIPLGMNGTYCNLWSEEGQDMSMAQTDNMIRLLRNVLDRSETRDDEPQDAVREWLAETFMDDCGTCERINPELRRRKSLEEVPW